MLAGQTQVRPLRRWEASFFFHFGVDSRPILLKRGALLAALAAGANFEGDQLGGHTLREALVFSGAQWMDFARLVPDEHARLEFGHDFWAGHLFGSETLTRGGCSWTLCTGTLRQGKLAGLALHKMTVVCYYGRDNQLTIKVAPLSLLDMAVLQRQRESAEICAAAGVGAKCLQKSLCLASWPFP